MLQCAALVVNLEGMIRNEALFKPSNKTEPAPGIFGHVAMQQELATWRFAEGTKQRVRLIYWNMLQSSKRRALRGFAVGTKQRGLLYWDMIRSSKRWPLGGFAVGTRAHGCPWDFDDCRNLAEEHGLFEIVQWLRTNGRE